MSRLLVRLSRLVFTLFSYPAYEWTTYQSPGARLSASRNSWTGSAASSSAGGTRSTSGSAGTSASSTPVSAASTSAPRAAAAAATVGASGWASDAAAASSATVSADTTFSTDVASPATLLSAGRAISSYSGTLAHFRADIDTSHNTTCRATGGVPIWLYDCRTPTASPWRSRSRRPR